MANYQWHYKKDSDAWHEPELFNVYFGGAPVGRVKRDQYGPKQGVWQWSGRWGGLVDGKPTLSTGESDSLESALDALRNTAIEIAQEHPQVMRWVFEHSPQGRPYADAFLAALRTHTKKGQPEG
jgi:hypothetical protein